MSHPTSRFSSRTLVSVGMSLSLALFGACGKKDSNPPSEPAAAPAAAPSEPAAAPAAAPSAPAAAAAAPQSPEAAKAEARQIFDTTCAMCHGASGKGDGQAAAALNPKPRDYTDKAWQASVTDEDLHKIILLGGQAVGKSPTMPGQPQLTDKPAVVDELVAIIRTFGK